MAGPPSSGKTLLARTVPSILPPLSLSEALDVTKICSVAGMLTSEQPLVNHRPFRAPHHTTSHAGLVGGGRWPRPGEISLAHRVVLFLDELPEFGQNVLSAMNPCPCGYAGDPTRDCTCSPSTIARYQKRLSGPLLSRIDIHVEVPRVEYEKLTDRREGERSAVVRARVLAARARQAARFAGSHLTCNAEMGPKEVRRFCEVDPAAQPLLKAASQRLQLSARAFHRVLKLAHHRRSSGQRGHRRVPPRRGPSISPARRGWVSKLDAAAHAARWPRSASIC